MVKLNKQPMKHGEKKSTLEGPRVQFFVGCCHNTNWVVVSNIFYFHAYLWKIPILTNIFRWVGSTTIQQKGGQKAPTLRSIVCTQRFPLATPHLRSPTLPRVVVAVGLRAKGGWKKLSKKKPGCLSYIDLYRGELYCILSWTGSCMALFFVVAIVWGSLWTNQKNGKYHGNPQPSFLEVITFITHILRVLNLHFSWFWGPRVGVVCVFFFVGSTCGCCWSLGLFWLVNLPNPLNHPSESKEGLQKTGHIWGETKGASRSYLYGLAGLNLFWRVWGKQRHGLAWTGYAPPFGGATWAGPWMDFWMAIGPPEKSMSIKLGTQYHVDKGLHARLL